MSPSAEIWLHCENTCILMLISQMCWRAVGKFLGNYAIKDSFQFPSQLLLLLCSELSRKKQVDHLECYMDGWRGEKRWLKSLGLQEVSYRLPRLHSSCMQAKAPTSSYIWKFQGGGTTGMLTQTCPQKPDGKGIHQGAWIPFYWDPVWFQSFNTPQCKNRYSRCLAGLYIPPLPKFWYFVESWHNDSH